MPFPVRISEMVSSFHGDWRSSKFSHEVGILMGPIELELGERKGGFYSIWLRYPMGNRNGSQVHIGRRDLWYL